MSIKILNGIDVDNGVLYTDTVNDRVGIGTTSPDAPLHIKSTNFEMLKLEQNDANGGLIRFLNTDDTDGWFTGIAGTEKFIISRTADNTSPIITVEQNGDVGIGTDSPSYKLHNTGTTRLEGRITLGGDVNNFIEGVGNGINFKTTDDYNFIKGANTLFTIKSTGNVGIGTTIPSTKLHLADSNDVYLTLESTNASTAEEVAIKYSNFSTGSNYWWTGLNQSASYSLAYGTTYSGANVKMEISTAGDATFGGTVYIPSKLEHTGDSNTFLNFSDDTITLSAGGAVTTLQGNGNTTFAGAVFVEDDLYLTDAGTVRGKIQLNASDRDDLDIKAVSLGSKMKFFTVDTERMRIDSDGNVGIGTSSPTGKLEIQRTQITTQFDRDSFLRLHPSTTTNSGGFTNIFFGTSPVNNYGVAIGGLRAGTDGTPSFSVRMLDDSITGTEVLNIGSTGAATFAGKIIAEKGVQFTGGTIAAATTVLHTNNVVYARGGSSGMFLQNADGSDGIFIANDHVRLETGSAERMRITSSGDVGIGTTSPSAKLEVEQSNSSTNTVFLSNSYNNKGFRTGHSGYATFSGYNDSNNTTSGSAYGALIGLNTFYNGTNFYNENQYIDPSSILFKDGNILFHTNDISASGNFTPSERVRITKNGNVGIGTNNPGSRLEVNGEIDANGGDGYRIETKPFATWSLDLLTLGDWDGEGYATRIMGSNSSEVMRVTGTNVGIGTTAPGAKLEVNGNSRFIGSMQFYQGSTSNQYLNILQSGGSTFINTGTSGETIYFGAPSSNTTNLYIQGTASISSIANATTDTDKFLVSQSGTVQYRTGAQLASDIGAVTGGPFLPISGGTLTGGLSIPEYLYHSGDQNTNLRFQSDSIELYTGGWKVFGNTTLKYGALYGDNALRVYATQAGGYVNGSLEVSDYVKAVDGYKGYVSYFHNAGFFHSPRSQDGANPLFIPINSTGMSSSDQYYNTWVPLYAGRVRKIIIKHISGSTPVATACTFRKKINGTLSGTTYAGTVTGGGSAGMKVTFDFGTTNFTFNAEDEVQIGIVTGVATQPRMGGCSCQIWYEYNIT
jgi:hypothetical protein